MAATAVRVFGRPITDGTRAQRARAALNNQNTGGKLDQALLFTNQSQKVAAGEATVSTTFGRVYNSTGEPLCYVTEHDWEGKVVDMYPVNIQNGQWAVFQHVGTKGKDRKSSVAAVVYQIKDIGDAMVAWNNPWKTATGASNTAYCETNDEGRYGDQCDWNDIYEKLKASGNKSQSTMDGYLTKVKIDAEGNTPNQGRMQGIQCGVRCPQSYGNLYMKYIG